MAAFKVGDRVEVDSPRWRGIWSVAKVNPKTLLLEQDGQRLKAHATLCRPAGSAAPVARPEMRTLPTQHGGAFVRFIGQSTRPGLATGQVFVVLVDKYERVNCAKLGGDGGRYWRLQPHHLEEVAVQDLHAELPWPAGARVGIAS